MKHYVDPTNQEIYAFEDDGSQDAFIGDNLQLLSDSALASLLAELNPAPPPAVVIASTRYRYEVAGFNWNDVFIDTSRVPYARILAARTLALDGIRKDGDIWKCADPVTKQPIYRVISNAEMIDIGNKTYSYVQSCYNQESVLMAAVANGTYTDDMLKDAWPSQL